MTALRRPVTTALALAGVAALAAGVGVTAVALRVARNVVTPPRQRRYDIDILGVDHDAGIIVLSRTPDTVVPGLYSLWFDRDRGHARVGEIVGHGARSVTRRLHSVERGDVSRASRARWAGWWYLTPADLGVPFREVGIRTPIGAAPAWRIDSATPGTDWVIQVHGRAVTRAEGLRAVHVFGELGYASLLISYRNDGDAPASNDGRYALGGDEWLDVEAAVDYALHQGATRIVLMGWSMGGATVLQFLTRSTRADRVVGVVLESPVVDWIRVLRFQAAASGLPSSVRDVALAMLASHRVAPWVGLDEPIDFDRLDIVARAAELRTPMLVLHSRDDGFVPSDGSVALAAARPDIVRLELFAVARHTKLWNYDAPRWERAIRSWVDERDEHHARDTGAQR